MRQIIRQPLGKGFARIPNDLLRDSELSFKARGLLAMILSHADSWEITVDWIERQSKGEGRKAIQGAIKELKERGFVETKAVFRGEKFAGKALVFKDHRTAPKAPKAEMSDSGVFPELPFSGGSCFRDVPEMGSSLQKTISEEEDYSKEENHPPKPPAKTKDRTPSGEGFEAFWDVWPNKEREEAARKAWAKATRSKTFPGLPRLLEIIEALKASPRWLKKGGEYIPQAVHWLKEERWKEPLPNTPQTAPTQAAFDWEKQSPAEP